MEDLYDFKSCWISRLYLLANHKGFSIVSPLPKDKIRPLNSIDGITFNIILPCLKLSSHV